MKAKELRIGNIHETDAISIPRKGWKSEPWSMITAYGIHLVDRGMLEFKPIPLTEEWLIKLGFTGKDGQKKDDSGFHYVQLRRDKFNRMIEEGVEIAHLDCYDYVSNGEYHHNQLKHVHQLQNLYFALTGEELTIKE